MRSPLLECDRNGTSDDEQLAFAAEMSRCIVTRNRGDFIGLTLRFMAEQRRHSGVLLVPGSMGTDDYRGIAVAIRHYDEQHPEGIPPYTVDYLIPVPR
jgi:hypothetical protein